MFHSKEKLDENLIRKLLTSQQAETHYFLIENMEPPYFKLFLKELLVLAEGYDQFYMARLMEKMPNDLFEEPTVQDVFLRHFHRLEYAAQQELMVKLGTDIRLSESALSLLIEHIQANKTVRNDQIISLVCDKAGLGEIEVLKKMFDVLYHRQIAVSPASLELLKSLGNKYSSLKKRARRLARKH